MAADTAPATRLAANDMGPADDARHERLSVHGARRSRRVGNGVRRRRLRPGGRPDRQVVRRPPGGEGRQPAPATRRGGRPAGSQRRRQDHLLLHDHRPDRGRLRRHLPRRRGHHRTSRCTSAPAPGLGYLPQETSIFRGMTVEQNVLAVVELRETRRARGARDRHRPPGRAAHRPPAQRPGGVAVGRRAPAGGDRPRAGQRSGLHAARRAVRRHRPAGHRRHPRGDRLPEGPRHRHPDHRPQRARDARHHRHAPRSSTPARCCSRAPRATSSATRKCAASTSATGSTEKAERVDTVARLAT